MRAILDAASASDIGMRRDCNEDRVVADVPSGVFVICDGVGGHAGGAVAAELAASTFAEYVRRHRDSIARWRPSRRGHVQSLLAEAVNQAAAVVSRTRAQDGTRMGTTLTAVVVDHDTAYIAHVGDSRVYLLRNGSMQQLTQDHTVADEMYRAGTISSKQFATSRYRNHLSRFIGKSPTCAADLAAHPLQVGDRLLICSDGVFDEYDSTYQLRVDATRGTVKEASAQLINHANRNGGRDNISVILLEVKDFVRDRMPGLATLGKWFSYSKHQADAVAMAMPVAGA